MDAPVTFKGSTRAQAISNSATTSELYGYLAALAFDATDADLAEAEFKTNSGICVKDAASATKLVKTVKTTDVHTREQSIALVLRAYNTINAETAE